MNAAFNTGASNPDAFNTGAPNPNISNPNAFNTGTFDTGAPVLALEELIALRHRAKGMTAPPRRVFSTLEGGYRSPFKGRGMEFAETRVYQPGDDIRHMEWRVTARTGKPHVKLFREERERAVLVWTDCRPPMFHATRGRFKMAQAALAATLAAWSAVLRGDRLGGLIFSEHRHRELRPMRGDRAALELIRELLRFSGQPAVSSAFAPAPPHPTVPAAPTPTAQPLHHALLRLRRVVLPGSSVFLFSDFRGVDQTDQAHLARMAQHNQVTLFFIHDPLERTLPPPGGRYPLTASGSGLSRLLNVDDPRIRQAHAARFVARQEGLRTLCRSIGAHFISCSTEDDAPALLRQHLGALCA
ncbi:MAG: DUF58 domain-containing protein [Magnetococcales bacterium]|nr:DUF58 domain-containing protein [Magnetococcales bacterium]